MIIDIMFRLKAEDDKGEKVMEYLFDNPGSLQDFLYALLSEDLTPGDCRLTVADAYNDGTEPPLEMWNL